MKKIGRDTVVKKGLGHLRRLRERVVLASIAELLQDKDVEICLAALSLVRAIEDPSAVSLVLPLLKNPNHTVRAEAIMVLRYISKNKDVGALVAPLLDDPEMQVRYEAIWTLGSRPNKNFIPRLRQFLDSKNAHEVGAAITALATAGDRASAPRIIELLRHEGTPQVSVNRIALAALATLGDPNCLPQIYPFLSHKDSSVRQTALHALSTLADPACLPQVFRLISDKEDRVRQSAFNVLAAFAKRAHRSTDPGWRECLKHKDWFVRSAAIEALVTLAPETAPQLVAKMIRDPNQYVRRKALAIAVKNGSPPMLELIRSRLSDESMTIRIAAIRGLGTCHDEASIDRVAALLEGDDPQSMRAAVLALGDLRARAHLGSVLEILFSDWSVDSDVTTDNEHLRSACLISIGRLGNKAHVATIAAFLEDRRFYVRRSAALAIRDLAKQDWPVALEAAQDLIEAARAWWIDHQDDLGYHIKNGKRGGRLPRE